MQTKSGFRMEEDALGEVKVLADRMRYVSSDDRNLELYAACAPRGPA